MQSDAFEVYDFENGQQKKMRMRKMKQQKKPYLRIRRTRIQEDIKRNGGRFMI